MTLKEALDRISEFRKNNIYPDREFEIRYAADRGDSSCGYCIHVQLVDYYRRTEYIIYKSKTQKILSQNP